MFKTGDKVRIKNLLEIQQTIGDIDREFAGGRVKDTMPSLCGNIGTISSVGERTCKVDTGCYRFHRDKRALEYRDVEPKDDRPFK